MSDTGSKVLNPRTLHLIERLAQGGNLFTNSSPRITRAEIEEIETWVGLLQIESVHGAERGSPRMVYPLDLEKFRRAASRLAQGTEG